MDNPSVLYLDYAAATPVADFVLAEMLPFMQEKFYNPSSPYAPAIAVRRDYEAAKACIASVLGVKLDELIMTAGATESINLAFNGTAGHVVTSAIEHAAVLEAAKKHPHTLVQPDTKGVVQPLAIKKAITPATTLVSVALANNEIGTIQPLIDIAAVIQAERARRIKSGESVPIYFHTDASQGAGYLDLHVSRLGVDAMTLNAGKVYGPKQVGALWHVPRMAVSPNIVGGGQESGFRSGTENVAGVIGFATALKAADAGRRAETRRLGQLRDKLEQRLAQAFPEAVLSGNPKKRLPNFLHISFPGLDAERLLFALEMRGVLVATGSACAANKGTRSHVLTAIGLAPEVADGSIRITLGKPVTDKMVMLAGDAIIDVVNNERKRVGL